MSKFTKTHLYELLQNQECFVFEELPTKCVGDTIIMGKCKIEGHEISRKALDIYRNILKNNSEFVCQMCRKINREIKTIDRIKQNADYPSADLINTQIIYDDKRKSEVRWIRLNGIYNKYRVSEYGDVMNNNNRLLSGEDNKGYVRYLLYGIDESKKEHRLHVSSHVLVAICFKPEILKHYLIEHIDDNPQNNHIDNLRGGSSKSNGKKPKGVIYKRKNGQVAFINCRGFEELFNDKNECMKKLKLIENDYKKKVENFELMVIGDIRNMKDEVWVNIERHGLKITCSNMGRFKTKCGYITRGTMHKDGYYIYSHELAHRIIATTFLSNVDEGIDIEKVVIDHKDGCRWNNCVSNLEWVTQQENSKRAGKAHFKGVCQLIGDKVVAKYVSKIQAEETTGIRADNFKFCIDGLTNHAGGFQWKNLDEEVKEMWIADGYTKEDLKYKKVVQFGSKSVLKYKIEEKVINPSSSKDGRRNDKNFYVLGELVAEYESIGKGRKTDDPEKEIPDTTFRRLATEIHVKGDFYYLIGEKRDELVESGMIKFK